jgi:nitrogen fixation NifU-like protein
MTLATATDTVTVRKDNPLCGDEIELTITFAAGRIGSAAYRSRACSLANASARVLTERVQSLSPDEACTLASRLRYALAGADALPAGFDGIAPVLVMPSRRRCVLLPWQALVDAVDRAGPRATPCRGTVVS